MAVERTLLVKFNSCLCLLAVLSWHHSFHFGACVHANLRMWQALFGRCGIEFGILGALGVSASSTLQAPCKLCAAC